MKPTPYQLATAEARKARLLRLGVAPTAPLAARRPVVASPPVRQPKSEPETPQSLRGGMKPRALPKRTPVYRKGHPLAAPIWHRTIAVVADEFGVSVDQMLSKSHKAFLAVARHVAVGILCELTSYSMPQIGRRLGGRDHTTILNSRERALALFESEAIRNRVDQLKAEIMS